MAVTKDQAMLQSRAERMKRREKLLQLVRVRVYVRYVCVRVCARWICGERE